MDRANLIDQAVATFARKLKKADPENKHALRYTGLASVLEVFVESDFRELQKAGWKIERTKPTSNES